MVSSPKPSSPKHSCSMDFTSIMKSSSPCFTPESKLLRSRFESYTTSPLPSFQDVSDKLQSAEKRRQVYQADRILSTMSKSSDPKGLIALDKSLTEKTNAASIRRQQLQMETVEKLMATDVLRKHRLEMLEATENARVLKEREEVVASCLEANQRREMKLAETKNALKLAEEKRKLQLENLKMDREMDSKTHLQMSQEKVEAATRRRDLLQAKTIEKIGMYDEKRAQVLQRKSQEFARNA